ncbi:MAG TPA: FAD-dependent oxidoreductase [Candidatus Aminicenantes bacterium]|nr:FAD-dependent oxidoreductase [Candidatus Aminicenantes bacterium]
MDYDVMVVGAGIAGMEAAVSLGDMGYRVLLVEKEPSIGGKMILLSKVFPTLDCASCISTPKMAQAASHANIDLRVFSEVREVRRDGAGGFRVRVARKPAFVDFAKCTGCQDCEKACTVTVPDEYNENLVSRRVAHIAFPQAVPKKAVLDRAGTSPCTFACPAGIKANGYISLIRQGEFERAFQLVLDDAPLVGTLGRACYAPCQRECTREEIGEAPHIRHLKRFVADWYYERHPEPEYGAPEKRLDKRVAIVGSGPAGLSAAYFLARRGYPVTVFEADPEPGGMLRSSLPDYRLPKEVVDRDIRNVTALGVEIRVNAPVDSLAGLREQGFAAVLAAIGTPKPKKLLVPGEELEGVVSGIEFLAEVLCGQKLDLAGKRVAVIGGGNVAIDAARTALRLGAAEVVLQYRRSRAEMPASPEELAAAEAEGVELSLLSNPVAFEGEAGRLRRVRSVRMKPAEAGADGRRRTVPVAGSEAAEAFDLAVVAIGLSAEAAALRRDLPLARDGSIQADPCTLQADRPWLFAAGDAVTGPAMIVQAMGLGKRAAFHMDRWLRGEALDGAEFEPRLPVVDKDEVLARQTEYPARSVTKGERLPQERIKDFDEVELPFSADEAVASAANCLNCGICSECRECQRVCPADAIDFDQRERIDEYAVSSVVVATGFRLFPAELMETFGYGKYPNVITAMQMDRLVAPTRPYNYVLRPGDGKAPANIAYVFCTGSRDRTKNNPICSRVCCMYSLKQAQLLLGALPVADVTIYHIDIRAFGKGYDEFFEQTKAMGVRFVKGKVARISEAGNGNLKVRYEDIDAGGAVQEAEHDLVVLSVGIVAHDECRGLFADAELQLDETLFVAQPGKQVDPARTSIPGVFSAGTATGPLDIPDSILSAGAAAAQAAAYIERMKRKP